MHLNAVSKSSQPPNQQLIIWIPRTIDDMRLKIRLPTQPMSYGLRERGMMGGRGGGGGQKTSKQLSVFPQWTETRNTERLPKQSLLFISLYAETEISRHLLHLHSFSNHH